MKIVIFLLFFSLSLFSKTYTLQEVVDLALENSTKIEISTLLHKIQEKELDKSKSFYYPTASAEFSYDIQTSFRDQTVQDDNQSVEGTFNIEQVIYDRSQYLNSKKEKSNFTLTQLDMHNEKAKLVLEVIQTYLKTLFKKKQIELSGHKKNHIEKIVQKAELEYKHGFISKAEYQESLSQKYEQDASEFELELELENLKVLLEKLTLQKGIDVYNNIHMIPSRIQNFHYFETALENNYEIKTTHIKIEQSNIDKSIAYSQFEPTLSANYEYLDLDVGTSSESNTVSLVLTIPLFEGFSKYHNLEQSSLKQKQQQKELEDLKMEQYEKLKNSHLKITTYQKILALYPGIIDAKELRLLALKEEFNSGMKSLVELLDETNKYFEKYNKYVEYKYLLLSELASLYYETDKLDEHFITTLNGYINEK